jgi:hypothetical protein
MTIHRIHRISRIHRAASKRYDRQKATYGAWVAMAYFTGLMANVERKLSA